MIKVILNKDIKQLNLDNSIVNKMKDNNIAVVEDLWKMKRRDLKSLGFSDNEISQIIIKLQLCGIDLNRRVYH